MNAELTDPQKETLKVLVELDPSAPIAARDLYQARMGRPLTKEEKLGAGSAQAKTLERLKTMGLVQRVEGEGRRGDSPGYLPTGAGRIRARELGLDAFAPDLPPVRERRSAWDGRRGRIRSQDEEAAIASSARLLERVAVPGRDPEPATSCELVDREGTVWKTDPAADRDGWTPEGGDDLALRWTSPALFAVGPFVVMRPRRRSPRPRTS